MNEKFFQNNQRMKGRFKNIIEESIAVKQAVVADTELLDTLERMVEACVAAFQNDKKMLLCGNGGSAADAQHIACELSGRFFKERPPLFAEALHVNSSFVTAVANDYDYETVYARMVQAAGRKGDILVAISTSGNSQNIINAIEAARQQNMIVVGLSGQTGGKMASLCDYILKVPATVTPRIQEAHILLGHILCEMVEELMFSDN
jgi:D-sedoheptulose 7-phosphate isomerase